MGGETSYTTIGHSTSNGLSPRGRGNHRPIDIGNQDSGSIPAWAGKPYPVRRIALPMKVYPRVGGETQYGRAGETSRDGLSPRGRGNLLRHQLGQHLAGSIPAWAGKPPTSGRSVAGPPVYPRVGGETGADAYSRGLHSGLSPRGRGNRRWYGRCRCGPGSIPAWAGKPETGASVGGAFEVYPRVGGETTCAEAQAYAYAGLSPRGRGNPPNLPAARGRLGSIPAWAGKPGQGSVASPAQEVYPRVGGETSWGPGADQQARGLSPRGRGNRRRRWRRRHRRGSIPAWAGKPSPISSGLWVSAVYPRVGGETVKEMGEARKAAGLSPRGRGNRSERNRDRKPAGSIPAWAGKPVPRYACISIHAVYPRVGGETLHRLPGQTLTLGLSPRGRGNPW